MMHRWNLARIIQFAACLSVLLLASRASLATDAATELIQKYCHGCHGGAKQLGNPDLDVLDAASLTEDYIVKGDLDASYLWQRIADGEMLPESKPQPTDEEKETIKQWVMAGAPMANKAAASEPPATDSGDLDPEQLAIEGTRILNEHCKKCHGDGKQGNPVLDVTKRENLVDKVVSEGRRYIVPGKPQESYIWERVFNESMPPEKAVKRDPGLALSAEDRDTLLKWIIAGAPYPEANSSRGEFFDESQLWEIVNNDLRSARESDRRNYRYFTLGNVYNNSVRYTDDDFVAHQAAISKVVNSMSWESSITNPTKVDEQGIVWRIDMRDYGWSEMDYGQWDGYGNAPDVDAWSLLMHEYPYGIELRNPEIDDQQQRQKLRENFLEARRYTGCELPVLRGDWFVFHGAQSDLYYLISQIPANVGDLEKTIGVDVAQDFMNSKLLRAGVKISGVSNGNRLMDRHDSKYGYYWKSYDFARGTDNLDQLPLGPDYPNHPHARFAFEHDGGEMIFSLPNGLQGYILATGKDERLELGPPEVVRDDQATGGTGQVNNAISCMNCHAAGMRGFEDTIRKGMVIQGDARRFADDLYDPRNRLQKVLDDDAATFKRAARKAMSAPFGNDESKVPDEWFTTGTEPISVVARGYLTSVNAHDVAVELGIQGKENLEAGQIIALKVEGNKDLQRHGLATLANDGVVRRETWESLKAGTSIAQIAAQKLGYGGSVDARGAAANRIFEIYKSQRLEK